MKYLPEVKRFLIRLTTYNNAQLYYLWFSSRSQSLLFTILIIIIIIIIIIVGYIFTEK